MDYWEQVELTRHINHADFSGACGGRRVWMFTTHAETTLWDADFGVDDVLLFGAESRGLPASLLARDPASCLRIPMRAASRSLNLATAVGIALYEALRRSGAGDQLRCSTPFTRENHAVTLLTCPLPFLSCPRLFAARNFLNRRVGIMAIRSRWSARETSVRRRRSAWRRRSSRAQVVLIDITEGIPQGKGLDQWESAPIEGYDTRLIGTNGYEESAGSDIFVVTAGIARKPGMSRDDLLRTNAGIVKPVAEKSPQTLAERHHHHGLNPLDVMCYVAMKATGFPRERVIGMAGVLDTRAIAPSSRGARRLGGDIQAMVLGGHGDTMVPLLSYTTVSGIPITQLLDREKLDAIVTARATAAPRS